MIESNSNRRTTRTMLRRANIEALLPGQSLSVDCKSYPEFNSARNVAYNWRRRLGLADVLTVSTDTHALRIILHRAIQ